MTDKTFELLNLVDQYNSWSDCLFLEDIESTHDVLGAIYDTKIDGKLLCIYDNKEHDWFDFLIRKNKMIPYLNVISDNQTEILIYKLD